MRRSLTYGPPSGEFLTPRRQPEGDQGSIRAFLAREQPAVDGGARGTSASSEAARTAAEISLHSISRRAAGVVNGGDDNVHLGRH